MAENVFTTPSLSSLQTSSLESAAARPLAPIGVPSRSSARLVNGITAATTDPQGQGNRSGRGAALGPGATINGRYDILGILGSGGMGVVYRARDRQNPERPLALKTIRGELLNPISLSLFKAEFRTMSKLRHPNVAAVYDFEPIADSDDYLFSMELVEGRTIHQATANKTPEEIIPLIVQVCRALAYVHSRRVLHLDLKPANILVHGDQVKVVDFGLTGARPNDSSAGLYGTPSYMSPEVSSGSATVDHRADLYSLGIMIFELVCGRLPFQARSLAALLEMHARSPVVFTDEDCRRIPAWVRTVIERLCAKDPSGRFRSGNAVIEAINASGGQAFTIETSETRESYFFSGKFVGRDQEFHRLTTFIHDRLTAESARGHPTVMVCGPSGVGKSRLMLEVRREAQLSRFTFIEANCYDGSLSEYGPIADAIGYVVRLADAVSASDLIEQFGPGLARLSPDLAREKAIVPAPASGDAQADRLSLIHRVCEFLIAVADRTPFVLYFNDLQWGRSSTVELIGYLSRMISIRERSGQRVPLALLVTYRDDEAEDRPLAKLISLLASHDELAQVTLSPLTVPQLHALLASMLGIDALPEQFVARIAVECGGNPFFVGEVMRALVESGTIYLRHGEWAADREIEALDIPSTMTQALTRRLDRLTETERSVLLVMAMHGRPVGLPVLARMVGVGESVLREAVRMLSERHLAAPAADTEDQYRVSHDRLREMLRAGLSDDDYRKLSRTIAETIETVHGDAIDDHIEALAEHYSAARVAEKALHYCLLGGARAKRVHAVEVGTRLFTQTLEWLPASDVAKRLEVSEDLADMRALSGGFDEALGRYDAIFAALTDNVSKARILRKKSAVFHARAKTIESLALGWEGLSLLGEPKPRSRLALAATVAKNTAIHLWRRTFPSRRRPDRNPARRALLTEATETYLDMITPTFSADQRLMSLCVLRAVNLAESLGESRQLSGAYSWLGFGYAYFSADQARADYFLGRGLAIARALGSPWHIAEAALRRAMTLMIRGEWREGIEQATIARDGFQTHGDMARLGQAHCVLVIMYQANGQLEAARRVGARGLETLERVGAFMNSNPICIKCAAVSTELGEADVGLRLIERARDLAHRYESQDPLQVIWVEVLTGHCRFIMGDMHGAIESFELSQRMRLERSVSLDFVTIRANPMLARAYLEVRERTNDRRERDALLRKAKAVAYEGLRETRRFMHLRASALLSVAVYEHAAGNTRRALDLFDESIAYAEQQASPLMLADAHFELGRRIGALLGDWRAARQHLETALSLYRASDAAPYVARALAALETAVTASPYS